MTRARILLVLAGLVPLAGCQGNHDVFNPGGPRARQIANLMLVFFGVSAIVYLIVIAVLVWALLRKRRVSATSGTPESAVAEMRTKVVIAAGVGVTVVVLLGLAFADFSTQRVLSGRPENALRVLITGHQYWWEIEYDDPEPGNRVRTANEFRIPVARPVEVVLTSRDVIHSFWLPSLSGKKDLIPGHTNTELVIAEKPGVYTGQCAEFCGLQHAQMRLAVTAVDGSEFEKWQQQQLAEARAPVTDAQQKGKDVFERSTCALCHTIQGTSAAATVGPDLTHLASRETIAAGTLANTPTNLASWILAPQRIKPGAQMPATPLTGEELSALTTYLASLE
jgi:cytochrome c oxidase subunit 2